MSNSDPALSFEEFYDFQLHKIYIKDLLCTRPPSEIEAALLDYFSRYGPIIDLKVLQTCSLNSNQEVVRFRHL